MNKRARKAEIIAEMRAMDEKAKAEGRAFNDEEVKVFEEKRAEVEKLSAEIAEEERKSVLDGFSSKLPPEQDKEPEQKKDEPLFRMNTNGKLEIRTDMTYTDGGAAVAPEQFVDDLEKAVEAETVLYNLVDKLPVTGAGALGLPYEAVDASDAAWTAEVPSSDIAADSSWKFGKRSLSPADLTKLVKFSKKLLATSALPIETLARKKITAKLSAAFENGITNGSGTNEPLGVFTASADGIPVSRDVATEGNALSADDFINAYMAVRPAYRKKAVWVLNTAILKQVMKLKDSDGKYIWQESIRAGEPSTILGRPVYESEYAPSATAAGSYVAVFGDFRHYKFAYWKGMELTVDNLTFAGKNQIGIYGHTLADGCPTLPEAYSRIKIKE